MQQPRHAGRRRVARLRVLLRSGLVGLLAVPSVLGVTSVLGLTVTVLVPHRPGPTPADAPKTAAAAAAIARVATDRPSVAVSRNAVRVGRPAPATPAPTAGSRPIPAAAPGAQAAVQVVGLGDSVPAGSGCGCSDYVSLLAQSIGDAEGSPVQTTNLATPGQTSDGLLTQLGSTGVRSAVADADIVVVTIGANDVESLDPTSCPSGDGQDSDVEVAACYRQQLDALAGNLDRVLGQVTALQTVPGARVLVTGYWNVFLDGAVGRAKGEAYLRLADAATRAVNARISAAATVHGATFVDLFTPFRGSDGSRDCTGLLAPDGDHPDADGHALIARALAAAL